MMSGNKKLSLKSIVLTGCAVSALALASPALALQGPTIEFDIGPKALDQALTDFGIATGQQVLFNSTDIQGIATAGVEGVHTAEDGLRLLFEDTGVAYRIDDNGTLLVGRQYVRNTEDRDDARGGARSAQAQARQPVEAERDDAARTDADDEGEEADARRDVITVTGTNIRGIAPDSSPTFSFDRDEILETGVMTLPEFLRTVPEIFASGTQPENGSLGGNGSRDGGSTVDLRGFGAGRTLALLTGRRIVASLEGEGVDVSIIPLAALERVEAVTTGASSIYGSDAVGGVINFILRDDFEGAETSFSIGTLTDDDGTTLNASQAFGASWDTGNAMIAYDYLNQNSFRRGSREYISPQLADSELTPNIDRHSVFTTARQGFGERLELFGEAYFATEKNERDIFTSFTSFSNTETRRDSYGGTVGGRYDIGSTWRAEAFVTHSEFSSENTRIDLNTGLIGGAFPVRRDNSATMVEAKADGDLFSLPGGEVKLALGGQGRFEEYRIRNGFGTDVRDEGDTVAAYGELFVPLVGSANARPGVERLEINLSGRYEDFGGGIDSIDPQVGLVWKPTENLTLRGNWGTSFRTPTLSQQNFVPRSSARFFTFYTIPNAVSATPATLFVGGVDPDVGVEASEFWSAGFDYAPDFIDGLNLSLGYYEINLTDEIARPPFIRDFTGFEAAPFIVLQPSPQEILDTVAEFTVTNPADLDAILAAQGLSIDDVEAIYFFGTTNVAERVTRGFDASASYSFDTDIGRFGLSFDGTFITDYDTIPFDGGPQISVLDTPFNPVDLKLNGGVSWSQGGASASMFVRYVDDYTNNRTDPEEPIESWTTVDMNLSYAFEKGSLRDTRVSFSVQNVFDTDPPFVANTGSFGDDVSYDPFNASARGRFVRASFIRQW